MGEWRLAAAFLTAALGRSGQLPAPTVSFPRNEMSIPTEY